MPPPLRLLMHLEREARALILIGGSAEDNPLWHLSTEIVGAIPNPTDRRPLYTAHKELHEAMAQHQAKVSRMLFLDWLNTSQGPQVTYRISTTVLYDPCPISSEPKPGSSASRRRTTSR